MLCACSISVYIDMSIHVSNIHMSFLVYEHCDVNFQRTRETIVANC